MARGAPKGVRRGGRQKGTPNKVSADLKGMITAALEEVGGQAYLVSQARENPTAFMTLLGKILPKDINANVDLQYMFSMNYGRKAD